MKIGDKVRFLSEVGGGIVTGFQGKDFVLVEDADGFDIPMPIRECVVIETDDYNLKRKPTSSAPKQEGNKRWQNLSDGCSCKNRLLEDFSLWVHSGRRTFLLCDLWWRI